MAAHSLLETVVSILYDTSSVHNLDFSSTWNRHRESCLVVIELLDRCAGVGRNLEPQNYRLPPMGAIMRWAALTIAPTLVLVVVLCYFAGPLSDRLRPVVEETNRLLAPNGEVVSRLELGVASLLRSLVPPTRGAEGNPKTRVLGQHALWLLLLSRHEVIRAHQAKPVHG